MTDDLVFRARGVWKKYSRSLTIAARHGLVDSLAAWSGRQRQQSLRAGEFWSLQNIDLEAHRGDVIGLVGRNGAGKTTLLKVLSGLLQADSGRVAVHGSIGWLVDIGAGLHPHLTGRENVLLRGDMLGMDDRQRRHALEDVVTFADIGSFIDSPVSFYSSGMKARLGFGIATMVQQDLLIVDETLSVGDRSFRFKCYNRIGAMSREGAVLFVSHSMALVRQFCNRGVHIVDGKITYDGDVEAAIKLYETTQPRGIEEGAIGSYNTHLCRLSIVTQDGRHERDLFESRPFEPIEFEAEIASGIEVGALGVALFDQSGRPVVDLNSRRNGLASAAGIMRLGPIDLQVRPGRYYAVASGFNDRGEPLFSSDALALDISGTVFSDIVYQPSCAFRRMA